jgi:hypothetical protein
VDDGNLHQARRGGALDTQIAREPAKKLQDFRGTMTMLCRSYSGSPIGRMIRRLERLYHLAEAENLASILEHGLMSTEGLLAMLGISEPRRAALLCNHRPDSVRLSESVLIRDQRPMPPTALAPALEDGLEPADWYALLNGHVFLWPDRERMDRQRQACGDRPQVVLMFDGAALLDHFGSEAFLSPINSGNARRKPARRARDTLVPYEVWLREGWPTGQRTRPPAEVLFRCPIPVEAPYLIDIIKV